MELKRIHIPSFKVKSLLRFIWHMPRNVAIFFIKIWQKTLSPDHGPLKAFYPLGGCRFKPTCSEYSIESFRKKGLLLGSAKTIYRIFRCNPWSEGGYDPVDKDKEKIS